MVGEVFDQEVQSAVIAGFGPTAATDLVVTELLLGNVQIAVVAFLKAEHALSIVFLGLPFLVLSMTESALFDLVDVIDVREVLGFIDHLVAAGASLHSSCAKGFVGDDVHRAD